MESIFSRETPEVLRFDIRHLRPTGYLEFRAAMRRQDESFMFGFYKYGHVSLIKMTVSAPSSDLVP